MTLKELIKQKEAKHTPKKIGDDIALNIFDALTYKELYFEDCCIAESDYDFYDLINSKIKNYYYVENYGYLQGKIKLVVEVL